MEHFNAEKQTEKIVSFIRDYYSEYKLKGAVIGISGGKDSAVTAALFCRALGSEHVTGLALPCHSNPLDYELAKKVCDRFGMELKRIDLTPAYDAAVCEASKDFGTGGHLNNSNLNLKPRLRLAALNYVAAAQSAMNGGGYLVAGTTNKSELFVGYITKNDNMTDINVLTDFTNEEVIALGEVLDVIPEVLYRPPADGLGTKTDEEVLGVSYKEIGSYMSDPKSVGEEAAKRITFLHKSTRHKFYVPEYSQNNRLKIGVFGGSFNPVRNDHTRVAKHLLRDKVLDKVVFVPVGDSYHKEGLIDSKHRINMLQLAIQGMEGASISDYEVKKGNAYTYQTLNHIQKENPSADIILVMGTDNYKQLPTWKRYNYLINKYKILVIVRDEDAVSSTKVRKSVEQNKNTIHADVLSYIKENNLYANN